MIVSRGLLSRQVSDWQRAGGQSTDLLRACNLLNVRAQFIGDARFPFLDCAGVEAASHHV